MASFLPDWSEHFYIVLGGYVNERASGSPQTGENIIYIDVYAVPGYYGLGAADAVYHASG